MGCCLNFLWILKYWKMPLHLLYVRPLAVISLCSRHRQFKWFHQIVDTDSGSGKNQMLYLASCDTKTLVVRHRGTFWYQPEISMTSGSNVMAQTVVFMFWWHWPLTYVLYFVTRTRHDIWIFHAKFHKNRSSINGWYAVDTHKNTRKHTPKVKSIVSQIPSGSTNYYNDQWSL